MNIVKKGYNHRGLTVKHDSFRAERGRVMEIIYHLKRFVNLPRLEVKIAKRDEFTNVLGLGFFNRNAIIVPEGLNDYDLYYVVLHEVCHASFGIDHNENCLLMGETIQRNASKEDLLKAFISYSKTV